MGTEAVDGPAGDRRGEKAFFALRGLWICEPGKMEIKPYIYVLLKLNIVKIFIYSYVPSLRGPTTEAPSFLGKPQN